MDLFEHPPNPGATCLFSVYQTECLAETTGGNPPRVRRDRELSTKEHEGQRRTAKRLETA